MAHKVYTPMAHLNVLMTTLNSIDKDTAGKLAAMFEETALRAMETSIGQPRPRMSVGAVHEAA